MPPVSPPVPQLRALLREALLLFLRGAALFFFEALFFLAAALFLVGRFLLAAGLFLFAAVLLRALFFFAFAIVPPWEYHFFLQARTIQNIFQYTALDSRAV